MFNKEKDYFKKKMNGVQNMIWDLEFKRFKSKEIREEVREEYDTCKSRLGNTELQIKSQLKDPNKVCAVHNPEEGKERVHKSKAECTCEYIEKALGRDEIERLYDKKWQTKAEMDRYLEQIKQIDLDIYGAKVSNDYPEGAIGSEQQLESLRELKDMLKDYLKQI